MSIVINDKRSNPEGLLYHDLSTGLTYTNNSSYWLFTDDCNLVDLSTGVVFSKEDFPRGTHFYPFKARLEIE